MKQYLAFLLCACILRSAVGSSCVGRCNNYDSSKTCQCNSACTNHNDCCSDYKPACSSSCIASCGIDYNSALPCQCNDVCGNYGNCCNDHTSLCPTLSEFAEDLWSNDENGVSSSQYSYNRGTKITDTSAHSDVSSSDFFTAFDSSILNGATISKFYALLNNYIATEGTTETFTTSENAEIGAFLDAIFDTTVMEKTVNYLTNRSLVSSESDLRSKMNNMWFEAYNRQGTDDSSGFEHVFLGEWKSSTKVNGFHNWIQFYKEENENDINYFGYITEKNPNLISMQFSWGSSSRIKTVTSIMLGASPEFEMAMFTTCFLKHPGAQCSFTLDGSSVKIQTYTQNTNQVGSAYFIV